MAHALSVVSIDELLVKEPCSSPGLNSLASDPVSRIRLEKDRLAAEETNANGRTKQKQGKNHFAYNYGSASMFGAIQRINTARNVKSPFYQNAEFENSAQVDPYHGLHDDSLDDSICTSRANEHVSCHNKNFYKEIIDICDHYPDEEEVILERLSRQRCKSVSQWKGRKLVKAERSTWHIDYDVPNYCDEKLSWKLKVKATKQLRLKDAIKRKQLRSKERCTSLKEKIMGTLIGRLPLFYDYTSDLYYDSYAEWCDYGPSSDYGDDYDYDLDHGHDYSDDYYYQQCSTSIRACY